MRFASLASLAASLSLVSFALVGCGSAPESASDDAVASSEEALSSSDCFGTGNPKACLCQHRIGNYDKACEPGQFCSANFGCMAQGTVGQNCLVRPIAASDASCGAGLQCCPNAGLNAASNGGFDGTCRSSCGVGSSGISPVPGPTINAPMKGNAPSAPAAGGASGSTGGAGGSVSVGGSSGGSSSTSSGGGYVPHSAARGTFCQQNLDCQSGLFCAPIVGRCAEICTTLGCYLNGAFQCVRKEVSAGWNGASVREVSCR